jgi:ribosome-associated translation inhibitor RaiA
MKIQVNTDNHVEGSEPLTRRVEAEVEKTLGRFGDQVTRVEVYLRDANSHKSGDDDKRCLMEARLAGLQPIAVSHQAPTLGEAIDGAAEKLERTLDRTLGRLGNLKGRTSYGGDQAV